MAKYLDFPGLQQTITSILDKINTLLANKADSNTNGVANSAAKLSNTTAVGSGTQPVYFSADGVPVATTYSLNKSVPKDAVLQNYAPVQRGGGANQGNNKVYIGWTGNSLDVQVDDLNLGSILYSGTGKTPLLPVSRGGTGKTTGQDAANYFINSLNTGSATPVDGDYFMVQWTNGNDASVNNNTFLRKPMSVLWNYVKSKADNTYLEGDYAWIEVFKGITYATSGGNSSVTFSLPKYPTDNSGGGSSDSNNMTVTGDGGREIMHIRISGAYLDDSTQDAVPFVTDGFWYNGTGYYAGVTYYISEFKIALPNDDPDYGDVMNGLYITSTIDLTAQEITLTPSANNINIFQVCVY